MILGLLFFFGLSYEIFEVKVFSVYADPLFGTDSVFDVIEDDIMGEIAGVLVVFGAMFTSFSKIRNEDEYIAKLRVDSLVWATYLNAALLVLGLIFVYGMSFLAVMLFNMFAALLFFVIRFHFMLFKLNKTISDEE